MKFATSLGKSVCSKPKSAEIRRKKCRGKRRAVPKHNVWRTHKDEYCRVLQLLPSGRRSESFLAKKDPERRGVHLNNSESTRQRQAEESRVNSSPRAVRWQRSAIIILKFKIKTVLISDQR